MDPLGAQPSIIEAKDLPRWDADQSSFISPLRIPADSTASPYSTSPFPFRRDLNQKIAFWQVFPPSPPPFPFPQRALSILYPQYCMWNARCACAQCLTSMFILAAYRTGDVTTLTIESIVNPTNETLTDKNPISNRVFEVAGPELKDECQNQIGSK